MARPGTSKISAVAGTAVRIRSTSVHGDLRPGRFLSRLLSTFPAGNAFHREAVLVHRLDTPWSGIACRVSNPSIGCSDDAAAPWDGKGGRGFIARGHEDPMYPLPSSGGCRARSDDNGDAFNLFLFLFLYCGARARGGKGLPRRTLSARFPIWPRSIAPLCPPLPPFPFDSRPCCPPGSRTTTTCSWRRCWPTVKSR